MDIMNMTLNQILAMIGHNWTIILPWLITADTILIGAAKELGWVKMETFCTQALKLIMAIAKAVGAGVQTALAKKTGHAVWEFVLLVCCCVLVVGCALRYHETTFIQGFNVTNLQYGHFDNATINHEGNFYIGVSDDINNRSANNTGK